MTKKLKSFWFREQWNRSNILYADDLDTLSYIPITTLYFDRSQSIGPDDEYVSVINVPLMVKIKVLIMKILKENFFSIGYGTWNTI